MGIACHCYIRPRAFSIQIRSDRPSDAPGSGWFPVFCQEGEMVACRHDDGFYCRQTSYTLPVLVRLAILGDETSPMAGSDWKLTLAPVRSVSPIILQPECI